MDGVFSLGVKNREFLKIPSSDAWTKPYQVQVGCQLIQNIIHNKDYLIFKIPGSLYVFAV